MDKQSKLRPPSKIGRLCASQAPKPAVPQSPPRPSGDSSTVPNSVNVPRKRNALASSLSLDELDDGSMSSGRRPSSASDRNSSLGSDSLWGDARRLSEAGVRRTSDSSVVLTEDTDSFIIGHRVWVGGTKPGVIAYIGDTQFAPGEWAGIVLDEPIGKNDGSVANIRYFQCEPNKGIFSRLTRLTRQPFLEGGDVSMSMAGNGNISYIHSPTSPSSTPSRPPSSASGRGEIKVGDRVIVKSSTGSKTGMLRYMGFTQFAPGEWCGVECDDEVGKNDGSVQGVRYFTCKDRYGLFAPITKVSLSPTPNRRPSCAVHPPGLDRQNTKDSISSSVSSKVSGVARVRLGVNSLQKPSRPNKVGSASNSNEATLKDREMYIEQLLKERDMERLAMTRAASQAEEAERNADVLKQELRQVREVSEATEADLLHQVEELQREKRDLANQLEDDHNKLDNLDFRYEEVVLVRAELEATNKTLEERVVQLEQSLEKESKRAEKLEHESEHLFVAEESQARLRVTLEEKEAEVKSKTSQVQELIAERDLHAKEFGEVKNLLVEEQRQNNNWKSLNDESIKLRQEVESEVTKYKSINDQLEIQLKNLRTQLSESEVKVQEGESGYGQLKLKFEQVETQLSKDKVSLAVEFKALSEKYKSLQDENNNKSSEMSVLNLNVMQLQNKLKNKEDDIDKMKEESSKEVASLNSEIIELKNTLTTKGIDFETKEELLKIAISDLKQSLLAAKKEAEKNDEKVKSTGEDSNKKISALEDNLKEKDKQLANLKNDYESKLEDFKNQFDIQSKAKSTMKETNDKVLTENNELKKYLEDILQNKEERLSELKDLTESQKKTIATLDEEINEIKNINADTNNSLAALTLKLEDGKCNVQCLEDKCKQLTEQKTELENNLSELLNSSSDSSEQLLKLNDALRAKETECATLHEAVAELRRQADSSLQKTQQELQATQEKAKTEVESLQKSFNEKVESKEKECDSLLTKLSKANGNLEHLEKKLEELTIAENNMQTEINELRNTRDNYQYRLEKEIRTVTQLNVKLEESTKGAGEIEVGLREKMTSLEKEKDSLAAEVKGYKNKEENAQLELEERKKKEDALKQQVSELNTEKENVVLKFEEKIATLSKNLENVKANKEKSDNVICDKDLEIVQTQQSLETLKAESLRQLEEIKTQEGKITEMREQLEKSNLATLSSKSKIEELQQQLDGLGIAKNKLEGTITQKNTVVEQLENELAELKHKVSQTTEAALDSESLLHSLNKTLEDKCLSKDKLVEEMKVSKSQAEDKVVCLENDLKTNKIQHEKECHKLEMDNKVLEAKLRESEDKREQLEKLFSQSNDVEAAMAEKLKEVERLHLSLETEKQSVHELKTSLDKVEKDRSEDLKKQLETSQQLQNLRIQLQDAEGLNKAMENQLSTQREAIYTASKVKDRTETVQMQLNNALKENTELKKKLQNQVELTKSIPFEATNNNATDDIDPEITITFLNDIIGDLQRKVEQQAEQIKHLQSGEVPGNTTRVNREVAPRLFCDICDMFDMHDTDDCPRQAMDSPPPQQAHQTLPKGYQRPYCESCEMFGHDTTECVDETY